MKGKCNGYVYIYIYIFRTYYTETTDRVPKQEKRREKNDDDEFKVKQNECAVAPAFTCGRMDE